MGGGGMSPSGAGQPLQVLSADSVVTSADLSFEVTPESVIALRRPGSVWPALWAGAVLVALASPLIYSFYSEMVRKGFTTTAELLTYLLSFLFIPTALVLIATLRRRKLERGLKLIDNTITVLTPDEGIAVTQFPLADLKDVNVVVEPSATMLAQVCRLVLVRHIGGKVTVLRGMKYEDLERVAKALYPRMRVRVKGFEVKSGEEVRSADMITDEMRNHALHFTLDWGSEHSKPLLDKLRTIYPEIDDATVNELARICSEVTSFAWGQYEKTFCKAISESQAARSVRERLPFVSSDNLSHLQTQGMYYAWHG